MQNVLRSVILILAFAFAVHSAPLTSPSSTVETPSVPRFESLDRRSPPLGLKFLHVALIPASKKVTKLPLVRLEVSSIHKSDLDQIITLLFGPGRSDLLQFVQLWRAVDHPFTTTNNIGLQCSCANTGWTPENPVELDPRLSVTLGSPSFKPMITPKMLNSMIGWPLIANDVKASFVRELHSWTLPSEGQPSKTLTSRPVPFLHVALVPAKMNVMKSGLIALEASSIHESYREQIATLLFGPGKSDSLKFVKFFGAVDHALTTIHNLGLQCSYVEREQWTPKNPVELGAKLSVTLDSPSFKPMITPKMLNSMIGWPLIANDVKASFVEELDSWTLPPEDHTRKTSTARPVPKFLDVVLVPAETNVIDSTGLVTLEASSIRKSDLDQITTLLFGPGRSDSLKFVNFWRAIEHPLTAINKLGLQCSCARMKWTPDHPVELGPRLSEALHNPSFIPMITPEMLSSMNGWPLIAYHVEALFIQKLKSWTLPPEHTFHEHWEHGFDSAQNWHGWATP
ncbi:hypothetical protein FB446DRAFT_152793 [Lentinula raphanica]|nr:hypothetical protein FB446DRAFT_152793 [Lentinula raphanica]